MPNDFHISSARGESLLSRTARAALSCLDPARLSGTAYRRHAVEERLTRPAYSGEFSVPWMGDDRRVRADRGYFAAFGSGELDHGMVIFRSGADLDGIHTMALLGYLSACLSGPGCGGFVVFGLDRDPGPLSEGESMRLCQSFQERFRLCGAKGFRGAPEMRMPDRERGYLEARLWKAGGRWAGGGEPFFRDRAAGYGLCHFAQTALRRTSGERLDGKSAAVFGEGGIADHAAENAARLGARVFRGARPGPDMPSADVYFLCDADAPLDANGAGKILAGRPDGVFEGVTLACVPEAASLLRGAGILFAPAIAAGAGGTAGEEDMGNAGSRWETEKRVRAAMEDIFQTVWDACPGDLYRGASIAALERAGAALIRRGV